MIKQILAGIAAAVTLCGCASGEKYDKELNSFLEQPVSVLGQKMGRPSAARIIDKDNVILAYTKVNGTYVPSEYYINDGVIEDGDVFALFLGEYDYTPYVNSFGKEAKCICQTSFWVKNGIVKEWRTKGNNCVAY